MLLALDSTDSRRGGCTTYVALEVWAGLAEYGVLGRPRLVRLNPNVPFKTRGNGALCLEFGHGVGRRRTVAVFRGRELYGFDRIEPLSEREERNVFSSARAAVDRLRAPDPQAAATGLVGVRERPSPAAYWAGVRRLVTRQEALAWLPASARVFAWGEGRGVIGATAAAAWEPVRGTLEWIGYREPGRWGSPRSVHATLGPDLDQQVAASFDNWDPRSGHVRVVPASSCPVYAGVRGTDEAALRRCQDIVGPESLDAWALFETNHATGDHLIRVPLAEVLPFQSVDATGVVQGPPRTGRGGHVSVAISDGTAEAWAVAYEPTGEFRRVVRALRPGDEIRIEAAAHDDRAWLALEAVTVVGRAPAVSAVAPTCPSCGRRAKSSGRRSAYRCRGCHVRVGPDVRFERPEAAQPSARVTVPVAVRRHLARPDTLAEERLQLRAEPWVAA